MKKQRERKILYSIPLYDDEPDYEIPPGRHFSDETINSLIKLGDVLRKIHDRLMSEGYRIKDGNLYNLQGVRVYNREEYRWGKNS